MVNDVHSTTSSIAIHEILNAVEIISRRDLSRPVKKNTLNSMVRRWWELLKLDIPFVPAWVERKLIARYSGKFIDIALDAIDAWHRRTMPPEPDGHDNIGII